MTTFCAATIRSAGSMWRLGAVTCCCLLSVGAADPWTALAEAAAQPAETAKKSYEALLVDRPGFLPAHFNLGTLLIPTDAAKAVSHLEQATRIPDPDQAAEAWHNLALARWQAGQLEGAVAAMTEAARGNPAFNAARDEIRRAALARLDEARRKAEAEALKLKLPDATIEAHVGEDLKAKVAATGGAGGYRFAATAGPGEQPKLPPGLALGSDGAVTGKPGEPGKFPLKVMVQDSAGGNATGTVTVAVLPQPAILTERLDEAVTGQPYHGELRVAGLGAVHWRVEGLPAGLAVETPAAASKSAAPGLGVIAGTPTVAGVFALTITAEDGKRKAEKKLDLVVSDSFTADTANVFPATAWAAYSAKLGVRGPAGDYRFQAASTGGLAMGSDGAIAGTPKEAGTVTLSATITAPDGRSRRCDLAITVNAPPVIDESEPIVLQQGRPAQRPLKIQGGTPPLTCALAGGALPDGVRLDPDGALRGVPGEVGSFKATVKVTDRWKSTAQHQIELKVDPASEQPPPQDQKQDQPKPDTADQQDQKQDGKDDQKQDGKDDQKQAKDDKKQGKDDKGGKDGKDGEQQQAAAMSAAAADRFLDQLPEEDKAALRHLLIGGSPPPKPNDQPW